MQLYILTAAHASGGHGDTVSVLGVFTGLVTPVDIARDPRGFRPLDMGSLDHGFFIERVALNQPYDPRSNKLVYERRFHPAKTKRKPTEPDFKEAWFDPECERRETEERTALASPR